MEQVLGKIVDVLMLVFLVLTMFCGNKETHVVFAWIFAGLVVVHLVLNRRIILSWLGME